MGQAAFAPRAQAEAVGLLLLPEGTGGSCTGSGFRQVGARGPAVERRGEHGPCAVLQAAGAGRAARGPARELRHHAVPRAGHQAGLLCGRLRAEILTDLAGHHSPVQFLQAADAAALQPVLRGDTNLGPRLSTRGRDEPAPVPSRNLPLEQLQVPVADFKAPPLALGFVLLVAVGVERGPALGVGAPDGAAANAPRAAVPDAAAPVTCKRAAGEKCLKCSPTDLCLHPAHHHTTTKP